MIPQIRTNIFSPRFPYRSHLAVVLPAILCAMVAAFLWGIRFPADIFAAYRDLYPALTWLGTRFHDIYRPLAFLLWLCLFADALRRHDKRQQRFALWLLAAYLTINGIIYIAKDALGMPRPGYGLVEHPWSGRKAFQSFPSGTTSIMAGLIVPIAIWLHRRWTSACLAVLALAVVASRLWLGKHHPVDVLAGIAAGVVVAYLAFMFMDFTEHPGTERPKS